MTQPDTRMSKLGELKASQYAFYVDKGFDHGTFRQFFLQRDNTPLSETPDGRKIASILLHEVIHFRKDTSRQDEEFKEIVLLSSTSAPRKAQMDSRYEVKI